MQPKFQRKKAPPRQFFCQIKRETPLPPEQLPPLFTFPLSRGYAFPPFRRSAAAGEIGHIPRSEGDGRESSAETKRQDTRCFPAPLDSSTAARRPVVARLKARAHRAFAAQVHPLMEAELFAATAFAPCTVWPRTVMRGGLRKLTSEPSSVPNLPDARKRAP